MFRVGEDFQNIVVACYTANIFERTGAFAFQTDGVLRALLDRQDGFDMNRVFPTIAKIVLIDELEPLTRYELIQAVTPFVLQVFAVSVFFFGLAIILIVNNELVQMTVRPAHDDLQNDVQLV